MVATNGPISWAKLTAFMRATPTRALVVLLLAGILGGASAAEHRAQSPSPFAAQIASLSEPAGYFDTDNLISNERSYLQVLPDLGRRNVRGGAYIGVGPDQNFTYIAPPRQHDGADTTG
jgi:hypothetical protein